MKKAHRKQNQCLWQEIADIESQLSSLRNQLDALNDRSDMEQGETLRESLRKINVNLKDKNKEYESLQKQQDAELQLERGYVPD